MLEKATDFVFKWTYTACRNHKVLPMKTLAVDDDESIRELLSIMLAHAGISDVTVTSSADNALSVIAAQTEPFECLIFDIQMPDKSGIELCNEIRKLPAYKKTPIIMLTAMKEKSYIDKAFVAGATDYATKPIDLVEMHARLHMAKLFVEEQRRVRELSIEASTLRDTEANKSDTTFAERLEIGGLKGLVTTQTFENYVAQVSRAGFQSLYFYAVHIQDGQEIFDRSTLAEFEYALHHVADAIIASQHSGTIIMCYIGSGNFICSSSSPTLHMTGQIEEDIQNLIDNKKLTYDDGSPLDLEITVGETVQPLLTESSRLQVLEAQAVERTMVRVKEKGTTSKPVNIKCANM